MMMRQIIPYLLAALACIAFAPAGYASGVGESIEFQNLISQNEDIHITPNDLAFFLATHNYNAMPKDGYVQVKIDCTIYKLVPNSAKPGLADLSIMN